MISPNALYLGDRVSVYYRAASKAYSLATVTALGADLVTVYYDGWLAPVKVPYGKCHQL